MAIKKQRSPSYPGVPLQDAIERAKQFHKKEGKHATLVPTALGHWGYSTKSSGGLITVAALKAYGLMDDKDSGPDRKVFLTPFGLNIVLDERTASPDRDKAIQEAALMPRIMADLWDKYGRELPSHDTLRHYLRAEREFNESAVNDVIKVYLANLEFAKLNKRASEEASDTEELSPSGEFHPPPVHSPVAPPLAQGTPRVGSPAAPVGHGEEIGNYRVSKNTTIRLVATGPYSRLSIEALVKQLQLGLDLGNFDEAFDPEDLA